LNWGNPEQEEIEQINPNFTVTLTEEERRLQKQFWQMHTHDQHRVRAADGSHFSMPLTERLAQTLHQKQLWTATMEAAYQDWATLQTSEIVNKRQGGNLGLQSF
jgi:hypothetical protein